MVTFTLNPYPLTGVICSGDEYELWCDDSGAYWWFGYERTLGPIAGDEADHEKAEDLAFAALEGL